VIILPVSGAVDAQAATTPYASPITMLLIGGFMLAMALERWNLHARIALNVVVRAGGRPRALILGFMIAAALLSMWISNTATALMMYPIALSVARAEAGEEGMTGAFPVALLLGVAYAASIGGVATPIGTPTNLVAIGYLRQNLDVSVGFAQWMMIGLPAAALLVPAAWLVVTRWSLKVEGGRAHAAAAEIRTRLAALGRLSAPELRVAIVFALVAAAWVFRAPLIDAHVAGLERALAALGTGVDDARAEALGDAIRTWRSLNGSNGDALIAMTGALAFFLMPAGGTAGKGSAILDWETAARLPWGMLILFGGGLSLAAATEATGLATWLGAEMAGLASLPAVVIVLVVVLVIIFLTELVSNVAVITAFMPVIGALAVESGVNPVLLAAPAAFACSCAFMFPVATASNAIVYGSGHVAMAKMVMAGLRLNLIGIVLITALAVFVAPLVFG
jgi:sodium-dependent dicarboxylate transporter 2/3/5